MSRKKVCFRWLLVYRAIPVNGWRKGDANNIYPFCMYLEETTKHCLGSYFCWLLVHRAIPVNGLRKGNSDNMCPFCTDLEETGKHCLWSCDFAIKIWKRIITLLISIYPQAVYTWGAVLWAVVQDEPMVYEQDYVIDGIAMIHGLILT